VSRAAPEALRVSDFCPNYDYPIIKLDVRYEAERLSTVWQILITDISLEIESITYEIFVFRQFQLTIKEIKHTR